MEIRLKWRRWRQERVKEEIDAYVHERVYIRTQDIFISLYIYSLFMPMAEKYFTCLPDYGLIVCRECKHAVWPREVDSHLRGRHHESRKKTRRQIQEEVKTWQWVLDDKAELKLPDTIQEAIPELGLHDGY